MGVRCPHELRSLPSLKPIRSKYRLMGFSRNSLPIVVEACYCSTKVGPGSNSCSFTVLLLYLGRGGRPVSSPLNCCENQGIDHQSLVSHAEAGRFSTKRRQHIDRHSD